MAVDRYMKWNVIDPCDFRWRFWDGQHVVYNPASGDTHLLNPIAGEALQSLQQSPAGVSELAGRVASRLDIPSDRRFLEQVEQLVNELNELGLIESEQP